MNISSIISPFLNRFRFGVRQDPVRDWLVLLTLSILALVSIIAWNVWAFDTAANGGVIGAKAVSTRPVFDRSSINSIHSIFTSRADEEAKYVTGVYRYADPSQ